jgi:uncharacterized Zn finger protein (UPF0148 family)
MSVNYDCDECGKDRHADDGIICPECFAEVKAEKDDYKSSLDKATEYIDELENRNSKLEDIIEEQLGKDVLDSLKGV